MKFALKGTFKENIYNLMRKAGYHFQRRDESKSELSFTRPARSYPRFHLYLKVEGEESKLSSSPFASAREKDNLIFNLHLDQKRPIYKGAPAHAGEYEGEGVENEAERIKQILKQCTKKLNFN